MNNNDLTFLSNKNLKPILIFKHNAQTQTYNIDSDCLVVGRSKDADLSIDELSLSRHHFMILKDRITHKYFVKDLKSTNGILLNSKPVLQKVLTSNDVIKAGKINFKFILTDEEFKISKPKKISMNVEEVYMSFDKKIKPTLNLDFSTKNLLSKSLLLGLMVFTLSFLILNKDNSAKLTPIVENTNIQTNDNFEDEINSLKNISAENKVKALNYYKIALEHFDMKNYELSLNSMKEAYKLIPNSNILPVFISTAEDILNRYNTVDENLEELSSDRQKFILLSNLFQIAANALNMNNFNYAISTYQKIIEIDPYNTFAYDGILRVEELIEEKSRIELSNLENKLASTFDSQSSVSIDFANYNKMNNLFNKKDYLRAFEIANRIKNSKELSEEAKLTATTNINKINNIMKSKYANDIKDAKYYISLNADDSARHKLNNILRQFPYHKEAKNLLENLNKTYTGKAQNIYYRALVSESYNKPQDALSDYRIILQSTPKNDPYYKKAKNRLNKLIKNKNILNEV